MKYILAWLLVLGCLEQAYPQSGRIITGRLTDALQHTPVVGATVRLKQQQTQVISDANGAFALPLPSDTDTLLISHVGYQLVQRAIGKQNLALGDIFLNPSDRELAAVEVIAHTGYQQIAKERATGSFTVIDNALYNQQVGMNALDRLKYISNGVSFLSPRFAGGNDGSLIIRGLSTLSLSIAKPLVVVDNFVYESDLDNLDPNDIESITFLKDAAAGSIWGTKAGNGVIVITTKKSTYHQPFRVEVEANVLIANPPDLQNIPTIATSDFIDFEQWLFSKKYRFADTNRVNKPLFSPVYEILFDQQAGRITPEQATEQLNALRTRDVRHDFDKYMYQRSVNQQYAVHLKGGTDKHAWLLGVGFNSNASDLAARSSRYNLKWDDTYKIHKNLELTTRFFYTQRHSASGRPAYSRVVTALGSIPPYTQLADAAGNPLAVTNKYRERFLDTVGGGRLLDWRYYPLTDYKEVPITIESRDLNAMLGLRYHVLPGVDLDIRAHWQRQQVDGRYRQGVNSFYTRDLINQYTVLDAATGTNRYGIPVGDILDLSTNVVTAQDFRPQLNINQQWKKHSVVAVLGSQLSEVKKEGSSNRLYGYDEDRLLFKDVDVINLQPLFFGGSNFVPSAASLSLNYNRFASFYGNAAYTFDNRYTASVSARRDGSNLFGVTTNDRWKPLWSAGLSWNTSAESFYHSQALPYLRVRMTFGKQGNVDPSKVAVTTIGYSGTNPYTQTPWGRVDNFYNPTLKWEQVNMFNAGIDLKTAGDRVSASLEYFHKAISNLYGKTLIDVTAGLQTESLTRNVGNMRGNGIDIQLNTLNTTGKIRWTSSLIFNYYKDKVTKLYEVPAQASGMVHSGILGFENYPSTGYFAYQWGGLDPATGDPIGFIQGKESKNYAAITGDSSTLNDIRFVGTLLPLFSGAFSNTVQWRAWSLTALINYRLGYFFRRPSINYSNLMGTSQEHADYGRRWQQPGDEAWTQVPSLSYPVNSVRDDFYTNAEVLATNGAHVRFQYLNLSFSPAKREGNKAFQSMRISLIASNFGILWRANNEQLDPDYPSGGEPPFNLAVGLHLTF